MTVLSNNPPAGIGPYKFGTIVPNASYTLVKNPAFAGFKIPNIPTGFADEIDVTIDSNTTTEAQQVLDNQQDVFDPADALPASVLADINTPGQGPLQGRAAGVDVLLLPQHAGRAVQQRRGSAGGQHGNRPHGAGPALVGTADAGLLLPAADDRRSQRRVVHLRRRTSDPNQVPSAATVAKAKAMIASAGLAGTAVTVWSETRSPRQQFMAYYTDLLNQLGFKATLKVIADSVYFQTIGNQSLNAQTGFADWSQDFPNPSDFYLLVSKAAIQATNNENFGNVDDPKIESQLATLQAQPASQLTASTSAWQSLDKYLVNTQALRRIVRQRDGADLHLQPD